MYREKHRGRTRVHKWMLATATVMFLLAVIVSATLILGYTSHGAHRYHSTYALMSSELSKVSLPTGTDQEGLWTFTADSVILLMSRSPRSTSPRRL